MNISHEREFLNCVNGGVTEVLMGLFHPLSDGDV